MLDVLYKVAKEVAKEVSKEVAKEVAKEEVYINIIPELRHDVRDVPFPDDHFITRRDTEIRF